MCNIYKFSDVLGLRDMDNIVREMTLQWVRSSISSQCRDLSTEVTCSVLGFLLLREQGRFAARGYEIFVLQKVISADLNFKLGP